MSQGCDAGDQALTVIHELSHLDGVYSPAATDHAYGEDASIALSSDMALMNADNYTYYANGEFFLSSFLVSPTEITIFG